MMVPLVLPFSSATRSSPRSRVPEAPYSIEIPYNMKPEASAPRMKYFMAASVALALSRRRAISAYSDSDISSRPR